MRQTFFLRTPFLTAGNFKAPRPTDPKLLALKDLNLLKRYIKNQEASSILRVDFAISKRPHLHRAYLVTECKHMSVAVSEILELLHRVKADD